MHNGVYDRLIRAMRTGEAVCAMGSVQHTTHSPEPMADDVAGSPPSTERVMDLTRTTEDSG